MADTRTKPGPEKRRDQMISAAAPRRMLSIDEVLAIVPVSRSTLYRMEQEKKFPPSTYISANRRVWYEDEIVAWQEALPAHRRISKRRG